MTIDDIALTMIKGLGPKGVVHLLGIFADAETIFSRSAAELISRANIREDIARQIAAKESHRKAEKELKYMSKNGIFGVASTDGGYPPMLRECADFPHVLYVRGNADVLSCDRALSMVGTRTVSPYGQRMCDVLIGRLAEIVPAAVIVSGLAYGIDGECHRAAIRHGLPTIAVVANVLPDITPAHHITLAEEIVDKGGAIISELHSQTKQNGAYFIPRNRIIAGMSEGLVVVESPYDGGSLATAEMAESYERTVMAVPGRASDKNSYGTNMLIRHRRASMVCTGDDIIHELGWDITKAGVVPARVKETPLISQDEESLLGCFSEGEKLSIDALCERSGRQIADVSALLLGLELAGLIASLPGRYYERI